MGSTETMKPYWTNGRVVLWQGHVLDCLAAMEAGSVHCAVTSPPYWSLRSYPGAPVEWPAVSYAPMAGLPPLDIPGCDPGCEHVWGEEQRITSQPQRDSPGGFHNSTSRGEQLNTKGKAFDTSQGQYCQLCGGWRGCLGLESTPEMFVGHIVLIWRELWRVMRDDATCWLNFGDSYASQGGYRDYGSHDNGTGRAYNSGMRANGDALKPKDLIGIPWRVAFALQADGWYLRSDIIWAKGISFCPTYSGSCMPGSQQDRPTTSHEHVFLLSKKARYFYDNEAIREKSASIGGGGFSRAYAGAQPNHGAMQLERGDYASGRTPRTVWTINPGNFPGSHFATFPPALVEPMIKAGTSQRGCCPKCKTPWVRVTSKEFVPQQDVSREKGIRGNGNQKPLDSTDGREGYPRGTTAVTTTGWAPTCSCGLPEGAQPDDFEMIHSPTGARAGDDPTMQTGRAGYNRPRGENEGSRPITRYEQRHYADQLKKSPYREQMEAAAGTAFEHYVRTDKSGARPVPDSLLSSWIERGWLDRVDVPEWTPFEPVPCTVLDPFFGSGTTGQVALKLGRRAVGIELSKSYCDDHIIPRLSKGIQMEMGL